MSDRVVFSPQAQDQLIALYRYIADARSVEVAAGYVDAIVSFCTGLASFPHRGRARDDIRPGLRIIGFRRRVVVAYVVSENAIAVIGVYYGGRDYESALAEHLDE